MGIKAELEEKLKEALRGHDEFGKTVYRQALASIKYLEKDKGRALDENETLDILQKEIKMRQETMEGAEKGGRNDLITEAKNAISLLEKFLPAQMSEEELNNVVKKAAEEIQAKGPADMGKLMKIVMPLVKGKTENASVSKAVKEYLQQL